MPRQIANVHDAFFKQVLADPALAGQFLREHLPREVADLLGPDSPEPLPAFFVDEQLREHHSDLLFRLHLKAGSEAFAYLLLEHKCSPDQGARLQLLRYVVRILTDWYEQNEKRLPLPPVLPLLAHQGPGHWKFSCDFVDLFGAVPAPLRRYLPDFRHALVDLAVTQDEALSTTARLRAFLKALKYARRPDLPERLDVILAEAPALERRDLLLILTYLDKGPVAVGLDTIRQVLHRQMPEREEQIMGWLTQPYFEQGIEKGIEKGLEKGMEKGIQQGRAEGQAKSLVCLLERRFGRLPAHLRKRAFAADVQLLDTWFDRAIDAADLQSVFAEPLAVHG